jgi:hypothetical protein
MKTKIIILCIALLSALSCDKDPIVNNEDRESILKVTVNEDSFNTLSANRNSESSDPFYLESIVIHGTTADIVVSYSGGCETHTFEVVWDGNITNTNPLSIDLILLHDAHGDMCEAFITETISVDLVELLDSIPFNDISINVLNGFTIDDSTSYDGTPFDFEESEICNIEVTAAEALCGFGLWGSIWLQLDDSVSDGSDYYFPKYLQPSKIDDAIQGFVVEPGKRYKVGALITDLSDYEDIVVCLAYPGPSIPVKIMCIEEIE